MSSQHKAQMSAGVSRRRRQNQRREVHPPQFQSTVMVTRRARFTATGGGYASLGVSRDSLLNHLVSCILTTSNARVLSGFRIRSVEMWSIGSGGVVLPTTVSVEWTSSYGPSRIVSDTSMSIAPAHVVTAPPPDSLASFWSLSGSNENDVVMILSIPEGTVLDITYDAIFQNGESPVIVTTTTSNTAGALYMMCFDGATSFGYLKPQSYVNTF